ncbi:12328_t:CDS:2 [Dentiscutata erythropus]|uniref:12328_t:CDS:1 n=1 Tax=Dentiscutata erythropus TaxID=1348616 RepID=A0A9N9N6D3_9GLOM|nr:12328_t:CDS:2 [Dentiscutata erythropus]
MLVYEQQNNKFGEIKSFVRLLEDLNTLEKETNPEANDALDFCKQNIFNKISENYPTTIPESDKRQLVVITGATEDIGFNIAKAFLKYEYKKYEILIKVIRHANSEYLEEEKLKRENRAKTLAEKGANVELVDYNKHNELVKALTGASFVVSALERFVPSEFYVDYKSITEDSIKLIPKLFWYIFKDKKDVLEKRKVLAYEYLAWLGFDTTTRDANFYAEKDKKVSLIYFAYWQMCRRSA